MWQFRFSPEMPSLAQIELPPFLAQLVVQLLVQLAGALLHLSRAELPEPVADSKPFFSAISLSGRS